MWGAPGSGKTTLLAALSIALVRQDHRSWRLTGIDPPSTEALIRLTTELANRRFPLATSALEQYAWLLERPSAGQPPRRLLPWGRRREQIPSVRLDLVDASGELYSLAGRQNLDTESNLLTSLENSRGIVYVFDPVRESGQGDVFEHTIGVLNRLADRMSGSAELVDGRLPHYVAVCVTKFDHPKVLETASRLDLIIADPADRHGFPQIADEDAEDLFTELTEAVSTTAAMVPRALRSFFHPDRLKFFVTSSIGFYLSGPAASYDPDDYQNEIPGESEPRGARVRGAVYPINVVEPVLWLAGRLAP